MTRYSIAEARNSLGSLVDEVEEEGMVELTRRGEPVAVVMSLEEYRKLTKQPGLYERLTKFRAEHDLVELDAASALAGVEDRSPGPEVDL